MPRGSALIYYVRLNNPTSQRILFSPCPAYTESLGTGGVSARDTYQLNCEGNGGGINANASLRYEIRMNVPRTMPAGKTKLAWALDEPGGPVTGTAIIIA